MLAASAAVWLLAAAEIPGMDRQPRLFPVGGGVLAATALAPSVRGPARALAAWCVLAAAAAALHHLVPGALLAGA